jgi:large subunit ribosomal protein L1
MAKHGKNYRKAKEQTSAHQSFSVESGFSRVKELAFAKFDESVDISVKIGIDAAKADQAVRGSVVLPHGTGKAIRIVVFAKGDHAEEAKKAGADFVGMDDLIEKISAGWVDFDYAVATPDVMGAIGKLAKILGPRGLLPNKKLGTVTFDVGAVVADIKSGRTFFKNDKGGFVQFSIGKVSFETSKLKDNFMAFIKTLNGSRPASAKGQFIRKISISSTMGVGILLDVQDAIKA